MFPSYRQIHPQQILQQPIPQLQIHQRHKHPEASHAPVMVSLSIHQTARNSTTAGRESFI